MYISPLFSVPCQSVTHYCQQNVINRITGIFQPGRAESIVTGALQGVKLVHDKINSKICVISKDPDQPVHPTSMARVLILLHSLDSLKVIEGTCDQGRLIRLGRCTG